MLTPLGLRGPATGKRHVPVQPSKLGTDFARCMHPHSRTKLHEEFMHAVVERLGVELTASEVADP